MATRFTGNALSSRPQQKTVSHTHTHTHTVCKSGFCILCIFVYVGVDDTCDLWVTARAAAYPHEGGCLHGVQKTDPEVLSFVVHGDHVEGHRLRDSQQDGEQPDEGDLDSGPLGNTDTLDTVPRGHCTVPGGEGGGGHSIKDINPCVCVWLCVCLTVCVSDRVCVSDCVYGPRSTCQCWEHTDSGLWFQLRLSEQTAPVCTDPHRKASPQPAAREEAGRKRVREDGGARETS